MIAVAFFVILCFKFLQLLLPTFTKVLESISIIARMNGVVAY
ncbi:MAG: hypothetical protein FKGGLIKP_00374 [Sodalis sp. Fse]|nr:MAG: hypothetical protein FKGGLIKP_00374 [Sodalis sp. Fse]